MKIKVAIIGSAGIPPRYGGFETVTRELVNHLDQKMEVTVYCSRQYYRRDERAEHWNNARLVYSPCNANGIQSILYDLFSFIHASRYSDVLLILGISGAIFLPFLRVFTRCKILVNLDGLEWKRKKWGWLAKRFLKLSERSAVTFSDRVITDNAAIQDYIKGEYGKNTFLIGYGANHVSPRKPEDPDLDNYPFLRGKEGQTELGYAVSVGRIVPENNAETILGAFAELPSRDLVMVGNWNSSRYGKSLRSRFRNQRNIFLYDPVYNQETLDMLRSGSGLYIHGHSAGGTNPSLIEAMYLGLPVIAHKNQYNLSTTENQAYYFTTKEDLVQIIETVSSEELATCGKKLQRIARQKMRWEDISTSYAELICGNEKLS